MEKHDLKVDIIRDGSETTIKLKDIDGVIKFDLDFANAFSEFLNSYVSNNVDKSLVVNDGVSVKPASSDKISDEDAIKAVDLMRDLVDCAINKDKSKFLAVGKESLRLGAKNGLLDGDEFEMFCDVHEIDMSNMEEVKKAMEGFAKLMEISNSNKK